MRLTTFCDVTGAEPGIMCQQCEPEWAEHTASGGAGVQCNDVGCSLVVPIQSASEGNKMMKNKKMKETNKQANKQKTISMCFKQGGQSVN